MHTIKYVLCMYVTILLYVYNMKMYKCILKFQMQPQELPKASLIFDTSEYKTAF